MTKAMDRNICSSESVHLRLLVYYCSEIQSEHTSEENKLSYITKFNKEIEWANKNNIYTPYSEWH